MPQNIVTLAQAKTGLFSNTVQHILSKILNCVLQIFEDSYSEEKQHLNLWGYV